MLYCAQVVPEFTAISHAAQDGARNSYPSSNKRFVMKLSPALFRHIHVYFTSLHLYHDCVCITSIANILSINFDALTSMTPISKVI